jgi:hypothetical protein
MSVALPMGWVSLAELRRLLAEQRHRAAKHAIQRTWRLTANNHLPIGDAMQGRLLSLSTAVSGGRSVLWCFGSIGPKGVLPTRGRQRAAIDGRGYPCLGSTTHTVVGSAPESAWKRFAARSEVVAAGVNPGILAADQGFGRA